MKRSLFPKPVKQVLLLALPAAALMLGSSQAQTTVGINFQGTYGGYAQYAFGPVTATAFGVPVPDWFTSSGALASGTMYAGASSSLTVNWTAANTWSSLCQGDPNAANGAWNTPLPGNPEVLWGYLDDGSPGNSVTVSGLASSFPHGYVVQTIAAEDENPVSFANASVSDGVTTSSLAYTYLWQLYDWNGPVAGANKVTAGLSTQSGAFTADTITVSGASRNGAIRSPLCGFIITDQPVVSQDPTNVTVIGGNSFTLSAAAIGLPNGWQYQWQLNGANLAGANGASYTKVAAATDAGNYTLIAGNLYGSATSAVATVTYVPPVLVWAGNHNGTWDIGGTANWKNGGVVATYADGVPVVFDDTGVATIVSNAVAVSPYALTVTNNTQNYTISGSPIAGSTGLTKTGNGMLTLAGANTFTGDIAIDGGNLIIANPGQLGGGTYAGAITISNNASLVYNSTASQTLNGVNSGAGKIMVNAGTLNLGDGSVNGTFVPGGCTVSNGVFGFNLPVANGDAHLFAGTVFVNTNAIFNLNNPQAPSYPSGCILFNQILLTGAGTVNINGPGIVDFWASGSTSDWSGFTGQLNVLAGGVCSCQQLTTANATMTAGVYLAADAYLDARTVNPVIGPLTGAGTLGNSYSQAHIITVGNGNGSGTFSGSIVDSLSGLVATAVGGGTIGMAKIGTGTEMLSGACTYTGPTTVSGGTLLLPGQTAFASSAVTVNSGGTLVGDGTFSGSAEIKGGGTLLLGTDHTTATLNFYGPVALDAGSTSVMRISKNSGVIISDVINANYSPLTYGGTLVVTNVTGDGTPLAQGDTFTLYPTATYSGAFSSYSLPALPAGLSWNLDNLTVDGSISVANQVATPLFNPAAGGYLGTVSVTISSPTAGAILHYTTDGSDPTTSGTVISGPNPISGVMVPANTNMTIRAYATASGMENSVVAGATYYTYPTLAWTNPNGGSWLDTGNWTNGFVAGGSGVTADFSTLTLSSPVYVTLDGARTIGNLIFGDAGTNYTWELDPGNGGSLTLAATHPPTIAVLNGSATLGVALAGTNGLTKTGNGTLVLTGANTYTGITTVSNAVLQLGDGYSVNGVFETSPYVIATNTALFLNNASASAPAWNNIAGAGTFELNSAQPVNGSANWGTVSLPAGFTGTLQLDNGRVNTAPSGLGGATTVVINNGAQFLAYDGTVNGTNYTYTNNFSINGLGWGESGQNYGALRSSGMHATFSGNITLTGDSGVYLQNHGGAITIPGVISDGGNGYALQINNLVSGAIITLSGVNTYGGATTVSTGILQMNGSLAGGTVTVNSSCVLEGSGTIAGTVTVNSGGILQGGDATGSKTLTATALVALGTSSTDGTTSRFTVAAGGKVAANAGLNVNGTNMVNILDASLSVGTNTLFTYTGGMVGGSSGFGGFRLGALPPGVTAHLLDTGSAVQLAVTAGAAINTNPPMMTSSVSGSTLTLSWPLDHTGWRLQSQTNSLSTGLNTNWTTVSGSTTVNTLMIPITPGNPAVFFRLVYP